MKKVLVCVGTRPNLIKITKMEECFNAYPEIDFRLLHTGQHYDFNMNEIFFEQLKIKRPDHIFELESKTQIGVVTEIMTKFEAYVQEFDPDLVMVPGDVNSTFACAFVANRLGYKVAHIESGLRSFDMSMPEEVNRILTDDITDFYFVTEPSGIENLRKEGKDEHQIHHVGNTMIDSLVKFKPVFEESSILEQLNVAPKDYMVFTFHRPANVDNEGQLKKLVEIIIGIAKDNKVVFPIHPRTKNNLIKFGFEEVLNHANIITSEPVGYIDFMKLIQNSSAVITDSGGIQEETTFMQVPCLTIRPNTERPVTTEIGTNTLLDLDQDLVLNHVARIQNGTYKKGEIPQLWDGNATDRIVKIVADYLNN